MNPETAQYEAMGKELLRRCMAEEEPEALHRWMVETLARLGGGDASAVLNWPDSFDLTDQVIAKYEDMAAVPETERRVLSWPWESWRRLIDPLEPGTLVLITAPDGMGKTIYAESLAEHWAKTGLKVGYVHFELNRTVMMLRRLARNTGILVRVVKEGKLTVAEKFTISETRRRMLEWQGNISYVHTPGWTMERTLAEGRRLQSEGLLDVMVFDYLEKAAASTRQLQMFGSNLYQREGDNVEQIKNFSEQTGVPSVMVAQMTKEGKREGANKVDRNAITGSGEKSNKSNIVVLVNREKLDDGSYSNTVNGMVDKNTMGSLGPFTQYMQPEFFRVGDFQPAPKY